MSDVLELKEFEVISEHRSDEGYRIFTVEKKTDPFCCTKCGVWKSKDDTPFKKHDTRTRRVADIAIRGEKVLIDIKQRRYKCPDCGANFPELLDSVEPNDKVTKRLFQFIGKEALTTNFLKVAKAHGVSVDTVKRSFLERINAMDKHRAIVAPEYLGIDEIYLTEEEEIRKQPFGVFTDIKNKQVIDIFKGNDKETVTEAIKRMHGYENIKVVAMDMASAYRNAVMECCPEAYCVVDHFHVIQKTIMALDTVRLSYQAELAKKASTESKSDKNKNVDDTESGKERKELYVCKGLMRSNKEKLTDEQAEKLYAVLEKYPRLKVSYELKEQLREVYKSTTVNEAKVKYAEWENEISRVKKDIKIPEIKGIQRMINRLRKEVFAYFEEGWTNSFTENTNSLIRRIVRDGNGYGFEVLRGKILYGLPASKTKKVKVKDMYFYEVFNKYNNNFFPDDYANYAPRERIAPMYYVDLEELLQTIDGIEF